MAGKKRSRAESSDDDSLEVKKIKLLNALSKSEDEDEISNIIFVGRVAKIATKKVPKGSGKEKIDSLQLNVEDDEGKVIRVATSSEDAFLKYQDFFKKGAQYKFSDFKVRPPSAGNKIDNDYEIELLDSSDVQEVDEWRHKDMLPASEYTPLSEWENLPLDSYINIKGVVASTGKRSSATTWPLRQSYSIMNLGLTDGYTKTRYYVKVWGKQAKNFKGSKGQKILIHDLAVESYRGDPKKMTAGNGSRILYC